MSPLVVCAVALLSAAAAHMPAQRASSKDIQRALDEGAALQRSGDSAGALESYRWALQSADPASPDRPRALMAISQVEMGLGRYADATRDAAAAGELYEALGDGKGVGSTLNRRGIIAQFAGDYAESERLLTQALVRSTSAGDFEGRAEQLGNLGNSAFYLGRYADAARMYDDALALTTGAAGQAWVARRRAIILINQAALYQRLGRDQQALALYDQLTQADSALRPREQGEMHVNLGVTYRRLGDPIKALTSYDEARRLFAQERFVDGELNALTNRGIALALDLGRLEEAEQSFSMALETATRVGNRREMLHARLYRGETRLRAGHPALAQDDFAAGLELARQLRTPEEEWKALYGMGRVETDPAGAIGHLDEAVRTIEAIREAIRVQSLRSDFLTDKRVVYDGLISARMATAPADVTFNLLERSHSRVWRDRLGLSTAIDLASVQHALPDRLLLLDYWQSAQGSAVIAVSRSRAAVIPIDVNADRVQALINTMSDGASKNWRELALDVASHALPPADWFDGIDRLVVVPDGALAVVPFEVLPIGGRLLVERAAISYTPTAATLVRPPPGTRGWLLPWRLQARVFADPIFASAALDDVALAQRRLDASIEEARAVASELDGRALLHLGADSRKAYLVGGNEHAPILHLATHAVADSSAMEQSRIAFSPAEGSGAAADYLFLKEAYSLPLRDIELAVLSACETERGHVVSGEGVQSFSRAFLAAGARSTVTTMWRVADRPTANFMQVFYHHLNRGVPRDEALRRTKLRFLEPGSEMTDPHFWAAFVLTGDGLRPVPQSFSLKLVATAASGLIVIALLGIHQYRQHRARRRLSAAIAHASTASIR